MALNKKKLMTRALTAGVAALIIGAMILYLDKRLFFAFLALVGVAGTFEFEKVSNGFGLRLFKTPVVFVVIYGLASIFWPFLDLVWMAPLLVAMVCLMSLIPPREMEKTLPGAGVTLMAAAYLGLAIISLGYIFALGGETKPELGRLMVLFCVMSVWLGDSFAYLAGGLIGKTKIAPVISPNKTYEGTFFDVLGCLTAGLIAKYGFLAILTYYDIAFFTLVFGLLGFFGDLVESSWKRGSGIKDSGSLFPGHGGVLDRVDSIFLTAPLFYFYVHNTIMPRILT